ncbi:hypothetical protein R1sor_011531 [Riccia sorocarpa]|uniref:Uncharacterized protein n=1 Tax=Riccia sorocarpa TaxID=122646 RepID=A0ABD3I151_9MARC
MPPRPRYPSDRKDYHKRRNPDWTHSVRIPEDCQDRVQSLTDSEEDHSGSEDGETDIDENVVEEVGAECSEVQPNEERVIWDFTLVEDSQAPGESTNTNHSSEGPAIDTNVGVGSEGPQVDENVGVGNQDSAVNTNCGVGRQASYGLYSRKCLENFFEMFRVACHVQGCNLFIKGVSIQELQQLWSLQLSCDMGHKVPHLSGELEQNKVTPLITGKLYHSAICTGMSHVSLQSMVLELGIHVPRSRHFYDFQAGRGREIGWLQAALDLWESSKRDIQDRLVESGGKQQWPCCGNE